MKAFMDANSVLNGIVWGPYMLVLIVGTGIFFTIRTGVFQVSKISLWWKATFGQVFRKQGKSSKDEVNITPFQAVTTALASTVGTGNIAGVATAIFLGGPGAVFWMWVSGFFGMMTKYAEVVLAVNFREIDADGTHHGGPMYYIEKGLKLKWLAVIFSVFGALAAFGIGNMTQSNAIAQSLLETFNIPVLATGIAISIFCALVIIGGIKRIATVTEKLVPFMAVFYFVCGIIMLVINISKLPGAFSIIFANAFSFQSVGGGLLGYAIMRGMRYGIARGVFSNEAGLGSAPIAHAASRSKNPVEQGLWGVFEVFVDTIIICTLSALIILTAGLYNGETSGAALMIASFSASLGSFGGVIVSIAILCFASSTILGWSYYGQQCLHYLTGQNKMVDMAYKVLFTLLVIVGAVGGLEFVWDVADTLNGLMAVPNLIGLLLLSKLVFSLTKEYLEDRRK
ncbi:MAG: sodium:alanine symporter family protein [Oscillospiraceae bacterium]|nr:sodium:alanine symporter family protein [Oscillospiraceae bacterium]